MKGVLFLWIFLATASFVFNAQAQQHENQDQDSFMGGVEDEMEIDTINLDDVPVLVVPSKQEKEVQPDSIVEFQVINVDTIPKDTVQVGPPKKQMLMVERLKMVSEDYQRELAIDFDQIMQYIRNVEMIPHSEREHVNPYMGDELALRKYLIDRNIEVVDTTVALLQLLKEWYDYDNYWDPNWTFEDKPVFNKMFLPLVFDGQNVAPKHPEMFRYRELPEEPVYDMKLNYDSLFFVRRIRTDSLERRMMYDLISREPALVHYTAASLPKAEIPQVIEAEKIPKIFEPEALIVPVQGKVDKYVTKVKTWMVNLNSSIQFSQTYSSDNWLNGKTGTQSTTLLSVQTLTANYDSRKNLKWFNTVTWRLGFMSAPNDSLRSFIANDDQFRLDSKFMYKAFGKFDYTVSGAFTTRLFNSYASNTTNLASAFLSPANANVNVGLSYSYASKKGALTFSPTLAPLAVTWVYMGNDLLPSPNPEDNTRRSYTTLGSSFSGTMTWKITKYIVWTSRLYAFTNYKNTTVEFENTFNLLLNRYLSTMIYIYPRFDDTNPAAKTFMGTYFQLKETVSFGFNFKI